MQDITTGNAGNGKNPESSGWSRRAFLLCLILAALYGMLGVPAHVKATDCAAVTGVTPQTTAKVDCPVPPCKPNACSCYAGNCNAHCGPITKCVLLGSDPPITNPQWDEDWVGFPNLSTFTSGKCPPNASGSITCPATNNLTTR
jgi:hypothetical protein